MERNRVINKIWDTSYIRTITVWIITKKVKSMLAREESEDVPYTHYH